MKPQTVREFFRRLSEAMPAPETELEYVNDYTLLVAVVLSARGRKYQAAQMGQKESLSS